MTKPRGKLKLGLIVIIVTILFAVILSYWALSKPNEYYAAIDKVFFKSLLIVFIHVFSGLIGLFIYKLYYLPSTKRLYLFFLRAILLIGTMLTGAPVVLAVVGNLKLDSGDIHFEINAANAMGSSVLTFAFMLIFIYFALIQYSKHKE